MTIVDVAKWQLWMWQKKNVIFATSKAHFIILPHYFTTSHLSNVLSFSSIH